MPTYKILMFLKRRPGMSMEAFQDYYETHHAPLALKYGSGLSPAVPRRGRWRRRWRR